MTSITLRVVNTPSERELAYAIRKRVFIDEQHVPADEEYDADDECATHVLALINRAPAGTGRLVVHGDCAKIGRMAVLRAHRRSGVGRALMQQLISLARREGVTRLVLHAQTQALPFYLSLGFIAVGDEFVEAGIPHRKMERVLAD